jgi:hypothetical protein
MRILGILLLVTGLIALAVGVTYDTTVASGLSRVHNIGLMNQRQNIMILGGALAITGALLVGLAGRSTSASRTGQAGLDPRVVLDPIKTVYNGVQDIALPAYRLFLTRRFSIERDQTLGVYAVQDEAFSSLDEALRETDRRWRVEVAAHEADAERARQLKKTVVRTLIVAIAIAVILLGSLWVRARLEQSHQEDLARTQAAQARVQADLERKQTAQIRAQECTTLSRQQAARCLKILRADEACAALSGVDSIKCVSDFMNN